MKLKIIRCTRGKIFDLVADLRAVSATFGHWKSFELDADAGQQLYLPKGVAHGFRTLIDGTDFNLPLISARIIKRVQI
jgi:dTDP-4-dehydrorhamnose 3,5-epimerase